MIRALFGTIIILSLAGCATMSHDNFVQARTLVIAKCPVLKSYTPEQQQRAANELREVGVNSQLANMLVDYSRMRDACRAIKTKLQ